MICLHTSYCIAHLVGGKSQLLPSSAKPVEFQREVVGEDVAKDSSNRVTRIAAPKRTKVCCLQVRMESNVLE